MEMSSTSTMAAHQSSLFRNYETNKHNQTSTKTLVDQSYISSCGLLSTVFLNELIIEGQWKFQKSEDDDLRLKSLGIENLVRTCHDIMSKTLEIIKAKQEKQGISSLTCAPWPIVNLDAFKKLTTVDRAILNHAHLLDLMTIIFEATSTSAPNSPCIDIRNEVSEPVNHQYQLSKSHCQLKMTYETAFRHLVHRPDDHILQVALHASLVASHSRIDLEQLGEKLGVNKYHFDMGSLKDSAKTFEILIRLLREQKSKQNHEHQSVDTNKLPYKPKKKRGLNANVSGTKFAVGRLFLF